MMLRKVMTIPQMEMHMHRMDGFDFFVIEFDLLQSNKLVGEIRFINQRENFKHFGLLLVLLPAGFSIWVPV